MDPIVQRLRAALIEYVETYPAFAAKPMGAPNSPARSEQAARVALEQKAKQLIKEAK